MKSHHFNFFQLEIVTLMNSKDIIEISNATFTCSWFGTNQESGGISTYGKNLKWSNGDIWVRIKIMLDPLFGASATGNHS